MNQRRDRGFSVRRVSAERVARQLMIPDVHTCRSQFYIYTAFRRKACRKLRDFVPSGISYLDSEEEEFSTSEERDAPQEVEDLEESLLTREVAGRGFEAPPVQPDTRRAASLDACPSSAADRDP